ncbi:protein-tyrosine phosphatase-like protein [Ampelomyces quisqualis]|uniref:protein-tyrosine-phosphatase n=1 Tax=Ampelomyces quisqualis TaxID=50730 RepID=A0A6A5Q836_AMPQU|nr:protein-tyrosine phosphatase-like protein [Ampelomyces quisqualis]
MQSPSSPLATAGQRPDQSISVSSNTPNETSLADGVKTHDSSTHNGPHCDSGAREDPFEHKRKADAIMAAAEVHVYSADDHGQRPSSSRNNTFLMGKRLRSESRSSHQSEDLQEHSSGQAATMYGQSQKMTGLIDRELKEWPHSNITLTTSLNLHSAKQTTNTRYPHPWMVVIVPGLVLGDVPASICPEMLREYHINSMVSLYQCLCGWKLAMQRAEKPTDRCIFIRCQDSLTVDVLIYMSDICDFMDRMASPALQLSSSPLFSALPPSESILVHCEAGRSRSPTIIIAYLMRKYSMNYKDALKFVQTKRKVKPNPNLVRQLQIWEKVGYNVWEDDKRKIPKALYQAYLDDRAGIMDGERDLDAIVNAKTALDSPNPIGPKFEPPYCCKMVDDCPCKDSALRSPRNQT